MIMKWLTTAVLLVCAMGCRDHVLVPGPADRISQEKQQAIAQEYVNKHLRESALLVEERTAATESVFTFDLRGSTNETHRMTVAVNRRTGRVREMMQTEPAH